MGPEVRLTCLNQENRGGREIKKGFMKT